MKNKLILISLLVIFIVANGQAQSYFRFLTWTAQEVVECKDIVIIRDWINPVEGNRMFTIIVQADEPRTGILHINKYTNKVEIYTLNITGAEKEALRNVTELESIQYVKDLVWREITYNDLVDVQRMNGDVYINFYDIDALR